MIKKEISEIKKQINPNNNVLCEIACWYVDNTGDVIGKNKSTSFALIPDTDAEEFSVLLRKTLTGRFGKQLYNLDIDYNSRPFFKEANTVAENGMKDSPGDIDDIMQSVVSCYSKDTPNSIFAVIMVRGIYDIPQHGSAKSEEADLYEDIDENVYKFLLCAVCPVGSSQSGLCYYSGADYTFSEIKTHTAVQPPAAGFLYPSFRGRGKDINELLYFSKKDCERHETFVEEIFGAQLPQLETAQKEYFQNIVSKSLDRCCTAGAVMNILENIHTLREKASDGLVDEKCTHDDILRMLLDAGMDDDKKFTDAVEECGDMELHLENICPQKYEIDAPDTKMVVKTSSPEQIQTIFYNGSQYFVIPITSDVSLNGIQLVRDTKS